ncbi:MULTISPECIES: hypothetical protein [unclassified Neptuniibacter]|uniref:hypothetical protein n=1 Tax=unclassified Neptuniibacter TaxID=2630693 RepID=UPI0026E3EB00|nr:MULTISPECIES: hypothetical protein [unclassified Neptuniibacter]MDO6513179.1 hypothetical protein [Neptuniibacter sp. 2_MG-2023]MDO6592409.1 hypothetical protein [Neptuniibacter sp. 1_MG-2023]
MSGIASEMVLEIIELENGELAIRNADSDAEPMIKVNFSSELKDKLNGHYLDVARVMLTAGIQMVAESGFDLDNNAEPESEPEPIIH